jgi:hypothetical protein
MSNENLLSSKNFGVLFQSLEKLVLFAAFTCVSIFLCHLLKHLLMRRQLPLMVESGYHAPYCVGKATFILVIDKNIKSIYSLSAAII